MPLAKRKSTRGRGGQRGGKAIRTSDAGFLRIDRAFASSYNPCCNWACKSNTDCDDMRIYLRNIKTGLYLQEEGRWTADLELARCFRHSAEAMDVARKICADGLEVLLNFEEPPRQVALPLP